MRTREMLRILAVQETHLLESHVVTLHETYRDLHILNSSFPDLPNQGGVAVVLNKHLVRTESARHWNLIPGRAILVSIDWHHGQRLALLAVYAPTNPTDNRAFWYDVRDALIAAGARVPKPQVLLGDLNMVESAADRFPAHLNTQDASASFLELMAWLDLVDGWRRMNSRLHRPTFRSATREHTPESTASTYPVSAWCRTDHSPVSVELVNASMPFVGPGRWTMTSKHMTLRDLWERGVIQRAWTKAKDRWAQEARDQERKRGARNDEYLRKLEGDVVTAEQRAADARLHGRSWQTTPAP
ncbi:hypothetical protein BKA62DRAFT_746551 [Auriculariales sp. MPI-PUGE-AT-0066]|nr:hypothetical protein BKA62DRAFT_746551 [Auriculariales sp. MPI-PUGE-AT-0066]